MKKVNLRDLYPDVYKNDHFVEVTEDVLETIRLARAASQVEYRFGGGRKSYYCEPAWYFGWTAQIVPRSSSLNP